jgi:hypothetical protein
MFPLPIRARGVSLSVASNWFWNCIIAVITPYMVDKDKGNMGSKVFFVWGSLCIGCFLWAYFLVYETKGMFIQPSLLDEVSSYRELSKFFPDCISKF